MKSAKWIQMTLLTSAFIAAGAFAAESSSSRKEYSDRYGAISDRNMFLRDRSKPASRPTRATQPSRQRLAEELLVLRGIVFEDDGFRAYIEDTRALTMQKVVTGDSIARGKITNIEIDAVEYEQGGQKTWIVIGHDMTGRAAASIVAAQPESSSDESSEPTTGPASTKPAAAAKLEGDPSLSAEQRMKLRRAAELKK